MMGRLGEQVTAGDVPGLPLDTPPQLQSLPPTAPPPSNPSAPLAIPPSTPPPNPDPTHIRCHSWIHNATLLLLFTANNDNAGADADADAEDLIHGKATHLLGRWMGVSPFFLLLFFTSKPNIIFIAGRYPHHLDHASCSKSLFLTIS